jgi:hypothetical protein
MLEIGIECRLILRSVENKTLVLGCIKKGLPDKEDRLVQGFMRLNSVSVISPPVYPGTKSRIICPRVTEALTGGYFATMNSRLLESNEGFIVRDLINF